MLTLLLFACTTAPKLTASVGASGAQVDLPGGATLDIPEGALAEDVEITATLVTDLETSGITPITEGFEAPAFAISLEPHGLTFDKPVTLTLPAEGIGDFPEVMRAEYDLDPAWEGVGPVTVADGVATVEISGFSVYALTLVKDGACPCFDRGDVETYYKSGRGDGAREYSNPVGGTWHYFDTDDLVAGLDAYPPGYSGGDGCTASMVDRTLDPTLVARFFPELTETHSSSSSWVRNVRNPSEAQFTACSALIRAGIAGTPGRQIAVSVHGLTATTDAVTVADSVSGESYALAGDVSIPLVIADGANYSLTVTEAPAGLTCAFDPVDPLVGTATSDITADIICAPVTTVPELPCNLKDDDLDGRIDEDATDAVVDTDNDGLVDACDDHPTLGCPCFTAADALAARADWSGAVCVANATGITTTYAFTGVVADHGDEVRQVLGAAVDTGKSSLVCGNGCYDGNDTQSSKCADAGYEAIVSEALDSNEAYQACNEIVMRACY